VDEAGQVGGKQLCELTALVQARGGRMILSGDTRQHGPVEASDILRAIEKKAGVKPAVLREIRRQNPALARSRSEKAFITGYRRAVKAASDGSVEDSFDQLDRLGCIREVPADTRRDQLAAEYLASLERKENPLVVAQTWNEVTAINDSIRAALREYGQIGQGITVKTLHAVDLTNAEKQDARFYPPGLVACFKKRYGRYARGDCCPVLGTNERGVVLEKNGQRSTLGFKYVGRLVLAEERDMEIAPGDRLQLKFNGKSLDGHPLANGELVTVRNVGADGSIKVEDARGQPKTLSPNQRLFNRGYAVTSYGSQGKTVDSVLFADSGCRAATSAEHWYVTISRGRKRVTVFTEDKAALRAAVVRQGGKDLALDLLPRPAGADAQDERNARSLLEQVRRHRVVVDRDTGNRARIRIAL
jgi:ATP-dependent exoDNAse (exonuclease V) alpha subunit